MTELLVHSELLEGEATRPPADWLLPTALIIGWVLAAVLIGVTFGAPQSGSIGQAAAPEALVDSLRHRAAPAVETTKIVPADALGTDVSWSPLTGDGSN